MQAQILKTSGLQELKVRGHDLNSEGKIQIQCIVVEYATRRGLSTWPKGARWPAEVVSPHSEPDQAQDHTKKATAESDQDSADPNRRLARSQESEVTEQATRQESIEKKDRQIPKGESLTQAEVEAKDASSDSSKDDVTFEADTSLDFGSSRPISSCSIWIGSSKDSDAQQSRFEDLTEEELVQRDGIGIVYMPLVPHPSVPGLDPSLISTWRRELDAEETDRLLTVAKVRSSR